MTARQIHVQVDPCVWTQSKASDACVHHGRKRALIVSILGFNFVLDGPSELSLFGHIRNNHPSGLEVFKDGYYEALKSDI